jgi:hypothetical protein
MLMVFFPLFLTFHRGGNSEVPKFDRILNLAIRRPPIKGGHVVELAQI